MPAHYAWLTEVSWSTAVGEESFCPLLCYAIGGILLGTWSWTSFWGWLIHAGADESLWHDSDTFLWRKKKKGMRRHWGGTIQYFPWLLKIPTTWDLKRGTDFGNWVPWRGIYFKIQLLGTLPKFTTRYFPLCDLQNLKHSNALKC